VSSELPPFQSFLDAHRLEVWRVLVATVGAAEAEDCFQETFLAALAAYPRLRADSNPRAWILTIAHRKALDALRARARRPRPDPEILELAAEAPPTPGPRSDVWAAVRGLPPRQRSAVVLRFAGDLSHREAGLAMDCTEQTARRALHDGLKNLREVWTS
jgi:RNA polymerase sigma factor (sigma-70 family)